MNNLLYRQHLTLSSVNNWLATIHKALRNQSPWEKQREKREFSRMVKPLTQLPLLQSPLWALYPRFCMPGKFKVSKPYMGSLVLNSWSLDVHTQSKDTGLRSLCLGKGSRDTTAMTVAEEYNGTNVWHLSQTPVYIGGCMAYTVYNEIGSVEDSTKMGELHWQNSMLK